MNFGRLLALADHLGIGRPDQVPPSAPVFAFCEPVTATDISPWHIRRLTDIGRKETGGADSDALCGRQITRMGWDLGPPVTVEHIDAINRNSSRWICARCAAAWWRELGT